MDEIDAIGRQMLIDRPVLKKGRLLVFRQNLSADEWFPQLKISLKKAGSDLVLWHWSSHEASIDENAVPPYQQEEILEKYFELEVPVQSPRGVDILFWLGKGLYEHSKLKSFSASLYLYPNSVEERGIQAGVVDFSSGLRASELPVFVRINFPW